MGQGEREDQEERSDDEDPHPNELTHGPCDRDSRDRKSEAEDFDEGPGRSHALSIRLRAKGLSSPAWLISARKRSYRVRPHLHNVAEREEIGETQILASLLGIAEMTCDPADV